MRQEMIDFEETLDARVLAKAIVIAVATIDGLPANFRRQQGSDRADMVHILHLMYPKESDRAKLVDEVEAITGRRVDLTDWQLEPYGGE